MALPDLSSVGGGGGSGVHIAVAFVSWLHSCRRGVHVAVVLGSGVVVQPWLLHLYMKLGCSPLRFIYSAGLQPTTYL